MPAKLKVSFQHLKRILKTHNANLQAPKFKCIAFDSEHFVLINAKSQQNLNFEPKVMPSKLKVSFKHLERILNTHNVNLQTHKFGCFAFNIANFLQSKGKS